MKMLKRLGTVGIVMATMALMAPPPVQAGTAGYTIDPPIIIAYTNGCSGTNFWANTTGQELRIVDITSTATGGTMIAYIDMMYGGPGLVLKPVCAGATLSVTNATSRTLTGGSADYVSPGQRVVEVCPPNLAAHNILLRLERKD